MPSMTTRRSFFNGQPTVDPNAHNKTAVSNSDLQNIFERYNRAQLIGEITGFRVNNATNAYIALNNVMLDVHLTVVSNEAAGTTLDLSANVAFVKSDGSTSPSVNVTGEKSHTWAEAGEQAFQRSASGLYMRAGSQLKFITRASADHPADGQIRRIQAAVRVWGL